MSLNEPPTNCHTCGVRMDTDYMSTFDLTGHGERIVWICAECRGKILNALRSYNWDKEDYCNTCSKQGSVTCVDTVNTVCCDCLEREIVAEMHDEVTAMATNRLLANERVTEGI